LLQELLQQAQESGSSISWQSYKDWWDQQGHGSNGAAGMHWFSSSRGQKNSISSVA